METLEIESSSDDEDIYSNSTARLKALKAQAFTNLKDEEKENEEREIEEKKDEKEEEIICVATPIVLPVLPTNEIMVDGPCTRSRTRTRIIKNTNVGRSNGGRRRTAGRSVMVDADLELVITSVQQERPILIGSDEEQEGKDDEMSIVISPEMSVKEDDNYEVDIKVFWRSTAIHRFNRPRHESFKKIFQYFADLEGISLEQIWITKQDRPIKITDTPASRDISVIDILEGGVVESQISQPLDRQEDENGCKIKVQMANKQTLNLLLKMDERFEVLRIKCAEELEVDRANIKLYFDGDLINSNDTPESLDLEQEACIDLRISKT